MTDNGKTIEHRFFMGFPIKLAGKVGGPIATSLAAPADTALKRR
jgi:hypothetical protein